MVSLTDFLTIADRLKAAKSEEDSQRERDALRALVEQDIRDLFDDANFPNRRRTLGAIKKRIPIFDGSSEDLAEGKLIQILWKMRATKIKGAGDSTLYHLPAEVSGEPEQISESNDGETRRPWSRLYAILIALAALVGVLSYLGVTSEMILEWLPFGQAETLTECIKSAKEPLEIDQCKF